MRQTGTFARRAWRLQEYQETYSVLMRSHEHDDRLDEDRHGKYIELRSTTDMTKVALTEQHDYPSIRRRRIKTLCGGQGR